MFEHDRFNTDKSITFTKEERELIYNQLNGRKIFFEEEMLDFASKKDIREVKRCTDAIERIQKIMNKFLG